MFTPVIEKGIPYPYSKRLVAGQTKYPEARRMEVGDSVYYPGHVFETRADLRRLVTAFARYAHSAKKHFRQEYDADGGVRIWRVL